MILDYGIAIDLCAKVKQHNQSTIKGLHGPLKRCKSAVSLSQQRGGLCHSVRFYVHIDMKV